MTTLLANVLIPFRLASFLHYILILSPRGPDLLSLIQRANDLVPYFLIRQTLRLGNVASMINAMTKIVLTKMSMSSFTGWIGGSPSDSGMNLLQ